MPSCHAYHHPAQPTISRHLTGSRLHLWRRTLCLLLADLIHRSTTSLGSGLCLLGLLLALLLGLLGLAGCNGLLSGGGAGFGTLGTALLDDVEGSSDDATLLLDRAAGALLGYFLLGCVRCDLSWFVVVTVCVSVCNRMMRRR